MHSSFRVLLLAALLVGCGTPPSPRTGTAVAPPPTSSPATPPPAAPIVPEAPRDVTRDPPPQSPPLHFIEDDFDGARAEAARRNVPLFVDVWANWCHSCMSLKEVVFPDPKLAKVAGRFVFLSLDSENEKNEAFFARHPYKSLPTLWVLSPKDEGPLLKWIGAATAEELVSLLEGVADGASPARGEAARLFVEANRASAAGHPADAIALYQRAISAGKHDWPDRSRALEALTMRFAETGRARDCAELAVAEAPEMPPSTSRVNVIVNGIDAASRLPDGARKTKMLTVLQTLAKSVAEDPSQPILVDDRSSLYEALVSWYGTTDPKEARRLATAWATMLERAAATDTTSEARRARDPHRLEAYLALGEPARAIPMLERSLHETPDDYNPPARLARAHFALGQLDDALVDLDRALPRCPGPRRLRLYLFRADVLLAKKDRAGARGSLESALTFARETHVSAQYDALVRSIETRLRALR